MIELPPQGERLDVLVQEKVLGKKCLYQVIYRAEQPNEDGTFTTMVVGRPVMQHEAERVCQRYNTSDWLKFIAEPVAEAPYSTDIADAWAVVQVMQQKDDRLYHRFVALLEAIEIPEEPGAVFGLVGLGANSAAGAICRAALITIMEG